MATPDLSLYKDVKVSRGFKYHYYYSPAAPGKPTLLLVHGFPSCSYDWRRQIAHLRPQGYGLIVPDILGAGNTAKPTDTDAFRFALIARDLVDLLDAEGLTKVVGIAHDWGSAILSRLANRHADRFHAFAWVAVSYFPPNRQPIDINELTARALAETGNERCGYWKFFSQPDAYEVCEKNIDSFLQLLYSVNPLDWYEWFTPTGKVQEWVETNRQPGIPDWLPQEEYNLTREKLSKAGLRSFLNYYTAQVKNTNLEDDRNLPVEADVIKNPALFIATSKDAVCRPAIGRAIMAKYVPQAKIVELDTGHWAYLEATERFNQELDAWLESFGL
ncbi:Alpha/Beta hydrolase protein [Trametes meyenii]|nr:Alpha/Beta hydrolase protein [Trametes meyenii]